MTKPKTLDQLRTEKERAETQLAQEQHRLWIRYSGIMRAISISSAPGRFTILTASPMFGWTST